MEFVARGVSGSKDRRPALDELVAAAKRRKFDVVVCWRLDRLGRNLRHLVTLLDELQALGVPFISMSEGVDCTAPAGKLNSISLPRWRSLSGDGFRSVSKPDWQGRRRKACVLVALDAASLLSDSLRSSVCPNAKPRGDWVSLVLLSSDCTKRDGTGLH